MSDTNERIRIITDVLEQHEMEYCADPVMGAPFSGFYECGCNEHGALGPLVGPDAKREHQARMIVAALDRATATSGSAA